MIEKKTLIALFVGIAIGLGSMHWFGNYRHEGTAAELNNALKRTRELTDELDRKDAEIRSLVSQAGRETQGATDLAREIAEYGEQFRTEISGARSDAERALAISQFVRKTLERLSEAVGEGEEKASVAETS